MNPLGFAYHALRSAGWWIRTWIYGMAVWCNPYSYNLRCDWGYSHGLAILAWQSARRAMGWNTRW